jgi:RNA polymerase sigma-70 factor, ECF subfamily
MSSSPARYFPGIFARRNPAPDAQTEPADGLALDGGRAEAAQVEVSDEDLILRLQTKDVEALGLLYRRYARLVYSVCFRILRDSAEAEDLVHEVFLCLYWKCKSFDPAKGAARSWLIQLTYSKCFDWRDYLRARHGRGQEGNKEVSRLTADVSPLDVSPLAHVPDPAYFVLWNASMVAAFKSLSKEQQLTLKLFYFKGYTFQEIAEQLGYSYGNVKHHVYRGIERLRQVVYDGTGHGASQGIKQRTQCEPQEMAG